MNEKVLYLRSWVASCLINLMGSRKRDFKKILVIKRDEIGDMITALHVFRNLHNRYPNAQIHLYCKPFNTIWFKYIEYVTCFTTMTEIAGGYDLIVDLRGDEETLRYALVHRPKYRLERGGIRLKNKFFGGQRHEIITNAQIIEPIMLKEVDLNNSITVSQLERDNISELIDAENIEPFAILHIGARDAARRWPVERFAECIAYLNSKGITAILVGGPDDKERNDACLNRVQSKRNLNLAGTIDLLEYAALCERAKLFLGNESGPVHIASAQGTPVIALFGPGVKNVFYPRGEHVRIHHYFLARGHKRQTVENSTIFSIKVDEVIESIDSLLQQTT